MQNTHEDWFNGNLHKPRKDDSKHATRAAENFPIH